MNLMAKCYDAYVYEPMVIIHNSDCNEIGIKEDDRVRIFGTSELIALVYQSSTLVRRGIILMTPNTMSKCGVNEGDVIDVRYSDKPESIRFIRKKMDGEKIGKEEIFMIVSDILSNRLSRVDVSAWLTALYINGMDMDEMSYFTIAMANTGDKIKLNRDHVFDFHSLGGVPGNKITPIIVSIVAAVGLMIPKLSSRAISSACGTSDFVETFCNVDLDNSSLRTILDEVGGIFAWGGSMNLAPVDDIVIRIEHSLGINPHAQVLASIMSKKVAVGATHLLIDIPTGSGTKAPTLGIANSYARDFMSLGEKIGIHVECAITYADQPLGNAIGPKLEARECMSILEGADHPTSIIDKACDCAGIILDMAGIPNGASMAKEILRSGKAHKKFLEIVQAQGGNPNIRSSDLSPGRYYKNITSTKSGYIHAIHNKDIVNIAKVAGSPNDKGAGIVIHFKRGQRVEAKQILFTIYADNITKLERAVEAATKYPPIDIEGILIKRILPTSVHKCDL